MARMTEEQKRRIRELYPTHSVREVAEAIGATYTAVSRFVTRHRLTHTAEGAARIERRRAELVSASRKRNYVMEKQRLLSGEPQRTRTRVSILSKPARKRMRGLCYYRGYFRSGDINRTVLYYDSETRRSERAEQYAREKYGITFEEGG